MELRIGFAKAKGFVPLAWAVELVEATPYSHIYFRWLDPQAGDAVFETTISTGTKQIPTATFVNSYEILEEYGFEISDVDFTTFKCFCEKYTGTPYATRQLLGAAVAKILCLRNNPFPQPNGMVCAELLVFLIGALPDVFVGGKEFAAKQNPDIVGLRVLYDFISKNKNATRSA